MIAGNHLPMLGTLTPERWGARFRRIDKPTNREYARLQVQAARRFEQRLFASDIADELDELRIEAEIEAILDADIFVPVPLTYHAGEGFGFYASDADEGVFDMEAAA